MNEENIYNFYHGNIDNEVQKALENLKKVNHGNTELLTDFYKRYYSINECTATRRNTVLTRLKVLALKYEKRLDHVTLEEFQNLFADMKEKGYKVTTKNKKGE
ncbi:MAG: hypothetical protein ABIH20_05130 [Candidatus Diapherotrites archaeon]